MNMEIINLILISIVLVLLAVGGMSVRLLFVRNGKFSGGSCRSSPDLEGRGITCGCGRQESCGNDEQEDRGKNVRPARKFAEGKLTR
jgi:hypothetical protein